MNNAEVWSSFGFWTLVVGLVGDVAVLTIPKHRDRLEKILSAFFTIVIIVGVAIERKADSEISRSTDLKIATLERDAKRFEKEAAQAIERATNAESHLAEARERAANAETGAANAVKKAKEAGERALKFEASIASANARSKEAEARVAKAQLDLAKLEAPRTLTAQQRRRIVDKLKVFAGQKFAAFVTPVREATNLLNAIGEVLISSGWVLVPTTSLITIGKAGIILVNGVKVQIAPSRAHDLGKVSRALTGALVSEKIDTKTEVNAELEKTPDVINVIVGDKW